jgi:hypothetical protein
VTDNLDRELAAARRELLAGSCAVVFWNRRLAGVVHDATVRVRWPHAVEPETVTNGQLAALRRLQLDGEMLVQWPFVPFARGSQQAPIREEIEIAARALPSARVDSR